MVIFSLPSNCLFFCFFFFFNDTATTEIYTSSHTLSLHDALPIWASCHLLCRALHGANDAVVRGAAAQVLVQGLLDLALARAGIAVEQRLGGHDHAVAAVAALAGLLLDESALQRVELLDRAQSLERGDGSLRRGRDGHRAGAHGFAVDQHGAGPALGETATELRAVQLQVVAQDVQERRVGRDRRYL